MFAALLFVILTGIAMLLYPGGNYANHNADGYSFTYNFFSDLGATSTYCDRGNIASMVFFVLALLLIGLSLMLFTFNYRVITERRCKYSKLGRSSMFFGIMSGIAFICIAATPWNHFLSAHEMFVKIAFVCLLIYIIIIVVLQIGNGWDGVYLALNIAYVIILAGYVALIYFGPGVDTASGLEIHVICQKFIVYSSILNLGLQAYGTIRYLLSPEYDNNEAGV